jgi:hypothetical protein
MPRLRLSKRHASSILGLLVCASLLLLTVAPAWADRLGNRGVELDNSYPSATTTYRFFLTLSTSSPSLGSIELLLCSNSPLMEDDCTIPAGLDVTNAQLVTSSGLPAPSVFAAATNELLISWGPSAITAPQSVSITLGNIINPSATGSYYGRLTTYASTNATGPMIDYGGLAFAITANLEISSYVPPYLTFCAAISIPNLNCAVATGNYVNFGALSPDHSSQATSQLMVATNAPGGYTLQVYGTTMTSGNNIIPALSAAASSRPGSPQFGLNLRANGSLGIGAEPAGPGSGQPTPAYGAPNSFRFVNNDIIASSSAADNWRRYTVTYLVNVPKDQAPGVYASTITYVAAGSF